MVACFIRVSLRVPFARSKISIWCEFESDATREAANWLNGRSLSRGRAQTATVNRAIAARSTSMPRPGLSGIATTPAFVLEWLLEYRLAEWVLRAVELQYRLERRMARRGMRQNRQKLQGRRQADAAAPNMRHIAHAERRGHVGNLLALRETAGGAGVGLQYVDCAPRQHLAKAPARELAFPAGDRDRLATAHFHVGVEIVGNHRLLEPADIQRCNPAAKFDRLDGVKAVVCIQHQAGRRPDRLANGADEPLVLVHVKTDLEFDSRKPLFDVALNLAHDVIERIARASGDRCRSHRPAPCGAAARP